MIFCSQSLKSNKLKFSREEELKLSLKSLRQRSLSQNNQTLHDRLDFLKACKET